MVFWQALFLLFGSSMQFGLPSVEDVKLLRMEREFNTRTFFDQSDYWVLKVPNPRIPHLPSREIYSIMSPMWPVVNRRLNCLGSVPRYFPGQHLETRYSKADPTNYSLTAYLLQPFREMMGMMGLNNKVNSQGNIFAGK